MQRAQRKARAKYAEITKRERRWETYNCEEPHELLIVAYGTMARICKTAIQELKGAGQSVGLFRPSRSFPIRSGSSAPRSSVPGQARAGRRNEHGADGRGRGACRARPGARELLRQSRGVVPAPEEVVSEAQRLGAL